MLQVFFGGLASRETKNKYLSPPQLERVALSQNYCNMTSVHFYCHKTQGNNPLLQGNDKFRQQRTGKLTGQWMGKGLKVVYRVRENPWDSVGSA